VYEVVDVSNQVDVGNIENEKDVHATDWEVHRLLY
jgi:hypothetical protein